MASELSFQDLMARVRTGDSDAVDELIARYGDTILRTARMRMFNSRLRRAFGSEDVFQSVIKSFCLRYAREDNKWQINTPVDLANLLSDITRNKVSSKARKELAPIRGGDRGLVPIDETVQISGSTPRPEVEIENKEEFEKYWKHFDDEARNLYRLRFEEKKSWDEIGNQLGVSGDACRKKLERILVDVRTQAERPHGKAPGKQRGEDHG
jgi:RNA polymerase sigma factor (sigma-70 family)